MLRLSTLCRNGAGAFFIAPKPPIDTTSGFFNIKRILLLRNGEHEANVDVGKYCTVPDWKIDLTEEGKAQALQAGVDIASKIDGNPVFVYFSPYLRSNTTMKLMLRAGMAPKGFGEGPIDAAVASASSSSSTSTKSSSSPKVLSTSTDIKPLNVIGVREDSRLRDGDIGRFANVEELQKCLAEREEYGKFFYRFPHGESGADVCDRVSSFLDAFQREKHSFEPNTTVLLVTHGLTIRMLVKRWFHLNVNTFHTMTSPPPGKCIELECLDANHTFRLTDESVAHLSLPKSLTETNGYAYRNKRMFGSLSIGAPYV